MANKSEDIKTIAKKYANKKTALAALSSLTVLGITILSSIPEFMIDASQVLTSKFLTKLIMTLIIGLTNLICFTLIGSTTNALNEASNIYNARDSFRTSAKDILEHHYSAFKQWIERVRRPAKQKEVDARILRHAGITNINYLDLDECQLRDLVKAPNKELAEKYGLKQITKEQFEVLMYIKTGKSALHFLSPDDYLLEKTMGVDQTDEEILIKQYKKRNWMFGEKIGSKVLIIAVVSLTLGCIGWSTAENIGGNMSAAQRAFTIIWDILSKLATAISSAFIGFFDGGKYNDFDAGYLQIKTSVHTQFKEDKEFKPLSEQELAKEEYINYHQQQEEKARKQLELNSNLIPIKEN